VCAAVQLTPDFHVEYKLHHNLDTMQACCCHTIYGETDPNGKNMMELCQQKVTDC